MKKIGNRDLLLEFVKESTGVNKNVISNVVKTYFKGMFIFAEREGMCYNDYISIVYKTYKARTWKNPQTGQFFTKNARKKFNISPTEKYKKEIQVVE